MSEPVDFNAPANSLLPAADDGVGTDLFYKQVTHFGHCGVPSMPCSVSSDDAVFNHVSCSYRAQAAGYIRVALDDFSGYKPEDMPQFSKSSTIGRRRVYGGPVRLQSRCVSSTLCLPYTITSISCRYPFLAALMGRRDAQFFDILRYRWCHVVSHRPSYSEPVPSGRAFQ